MAPSWKKYAVERKLAPLSQTLHIFVTYHISNFFVSAKRWVEVELKGQKGGETVEVYKDQGNDSPSYRKMSLPKFWGRKFTYPVRESVRVFFYKRHPDEVVQLRHPELYHITYGQEPAEWDCNLRFKKDASFDKSCVEIDQGIFRWEGSYVLEKKYQNMNEGNFLNNFI